VTHGTRHTRCGSLLSGHCKRAEEARERERERPFDSPAMAAVIEDSAKAPPSPLSPVLTGHVSSLLPY